MTARMASKAGTRPVLHVAPEGLCWERWAVSGPGAQGVGILLELEADGRCRYFIYREQTAPFRKDEKRAPFTCDSGLPPAAAAFLRDRYEQQEDAERRDAAKRWSMVEKQGTFSLDGWDDAGVRGTLTAILKDSFGDVEVTIEPTRGAPPPVTTTKPRRATRKAGAR